MTLSRRLVWLLSACAVMFPVTVPAQESATAGAKQQGSASASAEQVKRGEALYTQNCSLCHIPSNQKKRLGIQGPVLQGLFQSDADEAGLKQIIENGFPKQMPAFKYDLDSKQIDDLIAFLKSGAKIRIPG